MKRYSIFIAALTLFFAVSCEEVTPVPDEPQTPVPEQPEQPGPEQPEKEEIQLKENEYLLGDDVRSFASVEVSNFGEYLCIAATPVEGVEDFNAIFEQDQYFYVAISPLLNGKEFDLMTEEHLYTVISTLDGAFLETVAPSMNEEIIEGKCTFGYAEGVASVQISLTLADGVSLSAVLSAEEEGIVVNENLFSIGGNDKPVRTAFHQLEDGVTALYLTPAGIEFFDDLGITTYYAYIILNTDQCHGRTLSINDIIAAGYADNFNELIVDSNETETTGTVNVLSDPDNPNHYVVAADLDFAGTTLKLRFDGYTIDADAKEVLKNEIIYDGKAYAIKEAYLNTMPSPESVYNVILNLEDGRALNIILPSTFLDGNAHGFSQSPYLYMEFEDRTYSKAEGYSGTVTVSVENGTMKVEATNYDNLEVTYEGPFTEVL